MPNSLSRDTLLVQLLAVGESVDQLRAEIVELGGALFEAEHRRLIGQVRAIEAERNALLADVHRLDSGN